MATARAPSTKPNIFDGLAFVKYMKNTGRSYRKQAMELVSISRIFALDQEQTFRSVRDLKLRRVLEAVDEALCSATEAQKRTSKDADEKFKKAIVALSTYETEYRTKKIVVERMKKAKVDDKSSSEFLNRLKENFHPPVEGPTRTVEFRLHKSQSLPDRNPTPVKQVLSKPVNPKEVLWNFSRYSDERRVGLRQNPHFYELPTLAGNYGGEFRIDPIELETEPNNSHRKTHEKIDQEIDVLTDNSGRVYLETDRQKRAFGNVWALKKAIIFKDVCGKLEGEKLVGVAIEGIPNLWCFEEPPLSPTSRSPNRSNPSSTTTPTTSPTLLDGNWTEQIRRMLRSLDVNIRISAKPPGLGYSAPSSPTPSSYPSSSFDSPSKSQPLMIEIPGASTRASTRPWSPSSYRTAHSTPLSPRPPAPELSSRSSAPASPEPPPILLTHPTLTPASNTAAPTHATTLQSPTELSPRSPVSPSPEPHSISPTHPTVTPASITAAPAHASPLQSPKVALPLTGPAEPAPTSSGEVSREESISGHAIPPQVFNAEDSPPGPANISPKKVIDPTMPHAERDKTLVAGHVPGKPPDSGFVPTPIPTPIPTPVPTNKLKRSWYQKCIDVVKNGFGG
jgi:hypothetical protein